MIAGVGTDLVMLNRIQALLEKQHDAFSERILTATELTIFKDRHAKNTLRGVQYLATRFAAKEAFSKACGTGIREPVLWQNMEIVNNELGAPHFQFEDNLRHWMDQKRWRAHLSLSDEQDHAVAFVVIEHHLSI